MTVSTKKDGEQMKRADFLWYITGVITGLIAGLAIQVLV